MNNNKLIKALNKKVQNDNLKLKLCKISDALISALIAVINISIITIAIITLVKLINYRNIHKNEVDNSSFVILVVLTVLILTSFFITIVLAIYKHNTRQNEYKKIYNTLRYLEVKYDSGEIDENQLNKYVNQLWEKANSKTKIVITQIIKDQITSGGK
ncbi:hypothetical protein [Mycoplasmopsis glycophila]|uniref:Uncharacterized protein n=1 Tax=Mycoplasmopsis glycophila TaxID=171285 RepID=A0A449AV98_9BACT|nr:hypothetical protein [Mycoplasmopsis glycophila]VEU70392.1 Uncharacterised protein [Mycoplasmopsis glycophila]